MSTPLEKSLDGVIEAARLGGRVDTLLELHRWVEAKIAAANKENEVKRKELPCERNSRNTNGAPAY